MELTIGSKKITVVIVQVGDGNDLDTEGLIETIKGAIEQLTTKKVNK